MKRLYGLFLATALSATALLLSGCDTDGDACFGLCSKDEDRTPADPDNDVDRSCYADAALLDSESMEYADVNANSAATLLFQSSSGAAVDSLRPLLIWITGDTWRLDNSAPDAPSISRRIAEEVGAHLARINYRDATGTQWPEPIIDVNTAIRFLKSQAGTLNIDPERLILGGDQAGAHLAALAATSSGITEFVGDENLSQNNAVDALIALGGLYEFDTITADAQGIEVRCGALPAVAGAPIRRLFDCALPGSGAAPLSTCDSTELEQASPLFHASSDDPPALLWHGALDCDFPSQQSERFHARLTELSSVPHTLNILADEDASLASLRVSDVEIALAKVLPCEDL